MQPLQQAIQKLIHFFKEKNLDYTLIKVSAVSASFGFDLPIESFIGPDKVGKCFSFVIYLWEERDGHVSSSIRTTANSNIPYHPNFLIKYKHFLYRKPYAVWVGTRIGESDLEEDLKDMILSLQYASEYIRTTNRSSIGNKRALDWYLKTYHASKGNFPSSIHLNRNFHIISSSIPDPKKKFEIKPDSTPTKNRFKIKEERKFEPATRKQPQFTLDTNLNSIVNENSVYAAKLYISNVAGKQIFDHIYWGYKGIRENMSEQGGLLLGNVFYDNDLNSYYGIVEKAIPGDSAKGSAVYLKMGHDTWSEMMHKIDKIQSEQKELDLRVIGWYHTHPNELNVFMSGIDMNTQQKFFNEDWHFAIVLNPHRQIWKVFSGGDAKECRGYFLSTPHFPIDKDNSSGEKVINRQLLHADEEAQTPIKSISFIERLLKRQRFRIFGFIGMVALGVFLISFMFSRNSHKAQSRMKEIKIPYTVKENPKNNLNIIKIRLKQGSIIYNENFKSVFKKPTANSIDVSVSKLNDSLSKIETYLYVHRSAMIITRDSMLKIFEKIRTTDSTFRKILVGVVADTLSISKEKYVAQGDWFKINFYGFIKQ